MHAGRIWTASSISLFRLFGALVFSCIALQGFSLTFVASIYGIAAVTDLIDGYVARRLRVNTHLGRVIDLVSDKSLTIVSLLYASARGIDLRPLAVIAVREIVMIGSRMLTINRRPLFPTSRLFGGLIATLLWGNTLYLVVSTTSEHAVISMIYWVSAVALVVNLAIRVYVSRDQITSSASETLS
jgi:phosphatidylglycerophosphate synthase